MSERKSRDDVAIHADATRREFLGKSVGATVLGAAMIAEATKAVAQDAEGSGKFSTPD